QQVHAEIQVTREWDFLTVDTPNLDHATQERLIDALQCVSGVCFFLAVEGYEFDTFDDILDKALALFSERLIGKTFVVRCKRSGKHEFTSHQVEQYIGGGLLQKSDASGVRMKGADVTIKLEIKDNVAYLVRERFDGIGGYPMGSIGSVLSLISGGYDSPVASYLTMRRGLTTHFCFFNLGGRAHEVGVKEVAYHLWSRYGANHRVSFYTVPFEGVIAELMRSVDNSHMGVVLKRMMVRAAEHIAQEYSLKALVTGEAIAQVSSQTLVNLSVIDHVSDCLIMRPVVTMDKGEIIEIAKQIGTAIFAEHMPEYCGVISVKPKTRVQRERVEHEEARFDFSVLDDALDNLKVERIDNMSFEAAVEVEEFEFPVGESIIIDIRHPTDCERNPLKLDQKNKVIMIPFYKLSEEISQLSESEVYSLYCDKGVMSRLHASFLCEQGVTNVSVFRPNA
ncbi:MAG: tRNA uracil 4-sulfurtransferase ThiI, partial [Pseudomonadota bacterium]